MGVVTVLLAIGVEREARADPAIVTVGRPPVARFADPPPRPEPRAELPLVVTDDPPLRSEPVAREPELPRSSFRLTLGPGAITTGRSFGFGVGVAAAFGAGSVGGRLSAAWLRGEGTRPDGASTPTGDAVGHYAGEITLDLLKRGPLHPVIAMGVGALHVSRPDGRSGFAGAGIGRVALEYALGLPDADVRIGASVSGGMIGPADGAIADLRTYALTGLDLAVGF